MAETKVYRSLRAANIARQKEWDRGDVITASFRGLEMAGDEDLPPSRQANGLAKGEGKSAPLNEKGNFAALPHRPDREGPAARISARRTPLPHIAQRESRRPRSAAWMHSGAITAAASVPGSHNLNRKGLSMKKLILTSAATLAMSAGTAMADVPAGCNPVVANWQNAAPYNCAVSDTSGGDISLPQNPGHHDTEEEAETPAA